jgi:MraZ protein
VGRSVIAFSVQRGARHERAPGGSRIREEEGGMFLGEYQHTLDAKGRVSLPAKFRAELTGKLVVAKGFDKCLFVFTTEEHEKFMGSLLEGGDFDPRKRQLRRVMTSGSDPVEIDSAGRIPLTAGLRAYASLSKDVEIIGNGSRIEIWDVAEWKAYSDAAEAHMDDLAQELSTTGLL